MRIAELVDQIEERLLALRQAMDELDGCGDAAWACENAAHRIAEFESLARQELDDDAPRELVRQLDEALIWIKIARRSGSKHSRPTARAPQRRRSRAHRPRRRRRTRAPAGDGDRPRPLASPIGVEP